MSHPSSAPTFTAHEYEVTYRVRSLVGDADVASGTVTVPADTADEAARATVEWVHDHVPACDPRLDPVVEIAAVDEVA